MTLALWFWSVAKQAVPDLRIGLAFPLTHRVSLDTHWTPILQMGCGLQWLPRVLGGHPTWWEQSKGLLFLSGFIFCISPFLPWPVEHRAGVDSDILLGVLRGRPGSDWLGVL